MEPPKSSYPPVLAQKKTQKGGKAEKNSEDERSTPHCINKLIKVLKRDKTKRV